MASLGVSGSGRGVQFLLGVLFLFAGGASASPPLTSEEFSESWQKLHSGHILITEREAEKASEFQFVFVGGFLVEGESAYFRDNVAALTELGIPVGSIHVLQSRMSGNIEEAADLLALRLEFEVRLRAQKQLVVIAHSRGAVEALALALRKPEFVEKHVAALFLVQGAFGGSPVADFLAGGGTRVGPRMKFAWKGRSEKILDPAISRGMVSLTTGNMRDLFRRLVQDNAAALPAVGGRIFYITSHESPGRMSKLVKDTGVYIDSNYGESDGFVLETDQAVAGVGTSLISVTADHAALTVAAPVSKAPPKIRQVMTQAIVKAITRR